MTGAALIAAARAVELARRKVDPKTGCAHDSTWNEIERKERRMLRELEMFAGLKRGSLGTRDSR